MRNAYKQLFEIMQANPKLALAALSMDLVVILAGLAVLRSFGFC